MGWLRRLYSRSVWYDTFNFTGRAARARCHILLAGVFSTIVSGFTSGTFYTGLLLGYGMNIVNISIITAIPSLTSLFSLLTPFILNRFKSRRVVLSIARTFYWTIQILGINFLLPLVEDPTARTIGLAAIVFLANSINYLFAGYAPWHMTYLTNDVRSNYYAGATLINQVTNSVVMLTAGSIADGMDGSAQLTFITIMRYVAYAIAFLDIYFNQKPPEPEYTLSTKRNSISDVFRLPLSHKRFRCTMLIYACMAFFGNLPTSVITTWHLQSVHTGHTYINIINTLWIPAIAITTPIWTRFVREKGSFRSLATYYCVDGFINLCYAFVTDSNFLWLMTAVRLTQHAFGMMHNFAANNLMYINLPDTDHTCFVSFYTVTGSTCAFLGMTTGTWIVGLVGESSWNLFGHAMGGVPTILLILGFSFLLLSGFIMFMRKWVEPPGGETR